jgi:hypothetical protein
VNVAGPPTGMPTVNFIAAGLGVRSTLMSMGSPLRLPPHTTGGGT